MKLDADFLRLVLAVAAGAVLFSNAQALANRLQIPVATPLLNGTLLSGGE